MKRVKLILMAAITSLVTACGGGGGASNSSDGGNYSSVSGTSITIDKSSLSFTTELNQISAPQLVNVAFKGDGVIVGYAPGVVPASWLLIEQKSNTSNSAVFSISATNSAPDGVTITPVRFVTGKADGTQVQYAELTITVKKISSIDITSTPYSGSFIYGAQPVLQSFQVNVTGSNVAWTASSDQPWLKVLTTSGTGNTAINTQIDTTGLSAGNYQGSLTVTSNTSPNNKASLAYSFTIQNPTLTVTQGAIILGGDDGLTLSPQDLSFSINTGTSAYSYSIALTTENGKPWLQTSSSSGTVNSAGQTIKLSADPSALVGATYLGKATIEVSVGTLKLSSEIPVTFNKEASRLIVAFGGVALSSLPNQSVLSRNIKIFSTLGRKDIVWTATSDQPWLTVTPSGFTGDSVTLTASKGTLTAGQVYFANVTIKSPDTNVENQETIRVGFTISDVTPTDFSIETPATFSPASYEISRPFLTASPVEPLVFTNFDTNTVKAYNIYTGAEERIFSGVVAKTGAMTMSSDGRKLYIYDQINIEVAEVDAVTGTVLHKYSATGNNDANSAIAYMRPDGRPILIGAGKHIYDLLTQTDITPKDDFLPNGVSLSVDGDPSRVADEIGRLYHIARSALNGGTLHSGVQSWAGTAQTDGGQACLNSQGTRIYTASGAPYNFPGTNIITHEVEQVLPGTAYPDAIVCVWNGVIVGGASAYYDNYDIFIYNGITGQNLGNRNSSTKTGYRYLAKRGLAVSGDATRLINVSENNSDKNQVRFQSLPSIAP